MIHNIEEITNLPIVVVLYTAGSSGEFLAHALTQSFDQITKTYQFWETKNRCKYFDIFDRNLNSGFDSIDHNEIIQKVNLYLEKNQPTNTINVATAHPQPSSISFLWEFLRYSSIIEITVNQPRSKKFLGLAGNNKITDVSPGSLKDIMKIPGQIEVTFPNHLKVEWEDIMLTNTDKAFDNISQFLNLQGNSSKFVEFVDDYKNRNADLITLLDEN